MPKQIRPDELDRIVSAVGRSPEGVGVEGLLAQSSIGLGRRTLQRRLSRLVAAGRLVTAGVGRGLRYKVAPITGTFGLQAPSPVVEMKGEVNLPVSPEGEEIKTYVRQPRQLRTPVGYNLGFLEAYRPNETFYLPAGLRDQLRRMGTPPDGERPAGTFAREIMNRLLIDLSWASSRLEGNTYTLLDTERLIELGQAAEGKDAAETQMILNHKAAIELLVSEAGQVGFNSFTIFNLHGLLSDGLLADPSACGRLRFRAVEIGGSVYLPIALPQRLEEIFTAILGLAREIADPFEQSFFILVHLPYLQPFEDVNKRVSRLAANIPLIRQNLSPLSFIDVPERAYVDGLLGVYELNRIELLRDVFIWAYERSCQQYVAVRRNLVPPDPFRLRYRAALTEAVHAVVTSGRPATEESVRAVLPEALVEADRERFLKLVLAELENLYEGNAARFGLGPAAVSAWREAGAARRLMT
ncbi:MAG: Fic family protein [Desulfobacteraceae bacterium]|nr:Fic family protein [Desulfobacteraceae bacterium]